MAKTIRKAAAKKVSVKKTASPLAKTIAKKKTAKPLAVKAASAKKPGKAAPAKAAKKVAVKKAAPVKKAVAVKKAASPKKTPPTSPVKTPQSKAVANKGVKQLSPLPEIKSPAQIIADAAIHGILEKKGRNVICLDLKNVPNAVCDYFIICEAESTRQVAAIADSVDFEVKKATGENPFHTEGWENALWILLDYVNVVIHVFESETRHFYRLESLWADGEVKEFGVEYA